MNFLRTGSRLLLSYVILLTPLSLFAQTEKVDALVQKHVAAATQMREQIHQNPELGNREFKTAELVANYLKSLGLEVKTGVAHTGVIGILKGAKPGPVVAVRADMDALPVTEETPYAFKSKISTDYLGKKVGVMHACGHDVHTSVQLGVASVLSDLRDEIAGTVKFIFQPAEEGPPPGEEGGAELMVKEGAFEAPRPDVVFGLHTFSDMAVGKLGYTSGPALAAVDHFTITLHGKQAHGAQPQASVDPIVMGSQVVMALQIIRSRNLHPLQPSVVTVGIFRGGTRFNIIPADVHLEGTVRTYDPNVRDKIEKRMREILHGITLAHGGTYELDYDRGTPATINNRDLTKQMVPTLYKVVGKENVVELPPTMGGEDFAYFANEVPGFFYRLGMVAPGTKSGGHHTPTFMADNSCIPIGMRAMSMLVLDYLAEANPATSAK